MIRVDRSDFPPPRVLAIHRVEMLYRRAEEHFEARDARSQQTRFKFEPRTWRQAEVVQALATVFNDKCAFCESPVGATAPLTTHHFRPKQEAVDADGGVSRPHYWWLAYEWTNLYAACQRCNAAAGSRFPVRGKRASPHARGETLSDEQALLLDPCRDEPDQHLAFDDDGVVAALSVRGEQTIDTFALNRRELVSARRQTVIDALHTTRARLALEAVSGVGMVLSPTRPYAGSVRQAVGRLLRSEAPEALGLLLGAAPEAHRVLSAEETLVYSVRERQRPVRALGVERVEIRNFRGIEDLAVDLSEPEDEGPWRMLLGENGHGKTTVLQALALVLMGEAARNRLKLSIDGLIRHEADRASITVFIRSALEPRSLTIDRLTGRFETSGDDTPGAIAAYGAGRLPAARDPGYLQRRYRIRPRIENLFDPHTPLIAATRWLLSLDEETFTFAARAVREVILEPDSSYLERRENAVVLRRQRGAVALEQLSDGYRSMITFAVDLMSFFVMRYGSMDAAEGIVLVDEVSAHLHPRWQMRVVEALRRAFPRLQFIATTHDPLSLRGMTDGEVVVLRRTRAGRIYPLPPEEVPSVRGLRVDELLTSEVFGLNTTIDPDLDQAFEEYYDLLASHERSPERELRIKALRDELNAHRQLGSTRRERLVFEAADAFLAVEEDEANPEARADLTKEAQQRLRSVWEAQD